jgi:hypothetical protein
MLLTQYIRRRCGPRFRTTSLPGSDEREDEADDARERLKRIGLDPQKYFETDTRPRFLQSGARPVLLHGDVVVRSLNLSLAG